MKPKKMIKRANRSFIDWYSMRHFISGFTVGLSLIWFLVKQGRLESFKSFILTGFIILLIWEIVEIALRIVKRESKKSYRVLIRILPKHIFSRESKVNIFGDVVTGMAGLVLAYLLF